MKRFCVFPVPAFNHGLSSHPFPSLNDILGRFLNFGSVLLLKVFLSYLTLTLQSDIWLRVSLFSFFGRFGKEVGLAVWRGSPTLPLLFPLGHCGVGRRAGLVPGVLPLPTRSLPSLGEVVAGYRWGTQIP